MTTEEILLTVLTVAITVLIATVLVVLVMVLKVLKKINTFTAELEHVVASGSQVVRSLAPIGMLTNALRIVKIMKKRK